jgi:WXXGXW repeat (2 copies)
MNSRNLMVLLIALPLAALDVGCTVGVRPPPDRVEVVPERPSPRHTWVRGRWDRNGDDWRWTEGRWEIR